MFVSLIRIGYVFLPIYSKLSLPIEFHFDTKNLSCLNFYFKIIAKVNLNLLLINEEIKFLRFKGFFFEGCHHYSSRNFSSCFDRNTNQFSFSVINQKGRIKSSNK